jgi:hypothetical protein
MANSREQRVLCHMAVWMGRRPVLVREAGVDVWSRLSDPVGGDAAKTTKLVNATSWFYDYGSPNKIDEAALIAVEKECAQ